MEKQQAMWAQGDMARRSQFLTGGSSGSGNNNSSLMVDRNWNKNADCAQSTKRIVERLTSEVQSSLNLLRCNESLPSVDSGGRETQGDYLKRVKASRSLPAARPLSSSGDRPTPSPLKQQPLHYNTRSSAVGSAGHRSDVRRQTSDDKTALSDPSPKSKSSSDSRSGKQAGHSSKLVEIRVENSPLSAFPVRSRHRRRTVVADSSPSFRLRLSSPDLLPYSLRQNHASHLSSLVSHVSSPCRLSARLSA